MKKKSKAAIKSLTQASLATVDDILQMPPAVQHSPPPTPPNSAAGIAGTGGAQGQPQQQQESRMAQQQPQPGTAQPQHMRLDENPIHGPFSTSEIESAAAAAGQILMPKPADDRAPSGTSATRGGASVQPPTQATTAAATATTTSTSTTTAASTSGVQGGIKRMPYKKVDKKQQQSLERSARARQRAGKEAEEPPQPLQEVVEEGGEHLLQGQEEEELPPYHPPSNEGGGENSNTRGGQQEADRGDMAAANRGDMAAGAEQTDYEDFDHGWGLEDDEAAGRRKDTPMPSTHNSGLNTPTFIQEQQSSQEWLYSQGRLDHHQNTKQNSEKTHVM